MNITISRRLTTLSRLGLVWVISVPASSVAGGYMTMAATPDFGRTISTFSLRSFNGEPKATASKRPPIRNRAAASGLPLNQGRPPRKLVTHHVGPIYCGDSSGRFFVLGNDRSTENPVFGNLFASDDLGKTWTWLEPQTLDQHCQGPNPRAADVSHQQCRGYITRGNQRLLLVSSCRVIGQHYFLHREQTEHVVVSSFNAEPAGDGCGWVPSRSNTALNRSCTWLAPSLALHRNFVPDSRIQRLCHANTTVRASGRYSNFKKYRPG